MILELPSNPEDSVIFKVFSKQNQSIIVYLQTCRSSSPGRHSLMAAQELLLLQIEALGARFCPRCYCNRSVFEPRVIELNPFLHQISTPVFFLPFLLFGPLLTVQD